jgi:hypothetical protein
MLSCSRLTSQGSDPVFSKNARTNYNYCVPQEGDTAVAAIRDYFQLAPEIDYRNFLTRCEGLANQI